MAKDTTCTPPSIVPRDQPATAGMGVEVVTLADFCDLLDYLERAAIVVEFSDGDAAGSAAAIGDIDEIFSHAVFPIANVNLSDCSPRKWIALQACTVRCIRKKATHMVAPYR